MQRIIALVLALVLVIGCIGSCFLFKGNGGQQSGNTDGDGNDITMPVEGAIYSKGSTIGYLTSGNDGLYLIDFYNALASKTNITSIKEEDTPLNNEIIFGVSNRDVSKEAYKKLAALRYPDDVIDDTDDYLKWLIYTDGSSVAVAYDENSDYIALRSAVEYCVKNLVKDTLTLDPGIVAADVVNITEFYEKEDEELINIKWQLMEQNLDNGKEIVAALKKLYSLYDDKLVEWLANLYEPSICQCLKEECVGGASCGTGAFYYSNSARDTEGYLPDVESTNQTLNFLVSSGMTTDYTKSLSPAILDSIGRFVISLQDEDGYFYHPQWGNGVTLGRKSRDLMWSESIMRNLGLQPIYDTPNGMKGSGLPSEAALVSPLKARSVATVAAISTSSDPNLQDDVSFKAYLESLDVKNNSYAAGNTLAAYYNTIRSRDYQLQREGVGYSLIDIMIEHLNDAQNQADGSWYYVSKDDPSYSEYYAVNGIMKISCVYDAADVMMPNSDKALQKAIDAIVSSEQVTACVDVYNTWFTISNIFSILKTCGGSEGSTIISQTRADLRARVTELVGASFEKLATFKKDDGSFSYSPEYSSHTAQGAFVAVPYTNEGDVNATVICATGTTSLIFECLGFEMIPLYTSSDMYKFNRIIEKLQHVFKDELDVKLDIENGDNYGTGKYKDNENTLTFENTNATKLASDGVFGTDKPDKLIFDSYNYSCNATVIESDDYSYILSLKKQAMSDPFLYIYPQSTGSSSYVFEADICIMSGSTAMSDGAVFQMYFMNGETYWWPGQQSIYNADEYEGIDRYYVDSSKNTLINQKTWYNYRVEIQDVTTKESEVRLYINNVLVRRTRSSSSTSELTRLQIRFRMDSGYSQMLMDNVYFGSVANLPKDDTVLLPPVNIQEVPGSDVIEATNRGTGEYKDSAIQYTDTNATLLSLDGKIGTSSLELDPSTTSGMNYAKIVAILGDAALELGKTTGAGDPWLYIHKEQNGTGYVFETDFALMSGTEGRPNDNNLFSMYLSKDTNNSIFWGVQWHIDYLDGVYYLNIPTKDADGNAYFEKLDTSKWYSFKTEITALATGSVVRNYLNGELIHTAIMTSGISDISHMLMRFNLNTYNGLMYLDNTYFGPLDASSGDNGGNTGGDVEITPPDPADTVKNSANILTTATGADGIVVLMHDDGSTASIPIIDEVFRELGLRGNIALLANKVYSDGTYNSSAIASWQSYLDTGRWQLTSHSLTHEFPGLTDDDGLITQEVVISQQILRTAFPSQRVLTYAYPGYWAQKNQYGNDRFSAIMRELVGEHYIAGRDSYGDKNIALTDTNIDWTFAPSYQFDDSNVDAIINAIKKTQNGEMAVIFTHMVAANNDTLAGNTMYEKNLRAICEAIAKLQEEGKVWVAFYEDAVLYTREAQAATVNAVSSSNSITLTLTHTLDSSIYNYPLTVRTIVPESWEAVKITQGDNVSYALVKNVSGKACVDASVVPNAENAVVTPIAASEIPADEADPKEANRGTGEHKDNALDFTGTTASGLNQDGLIGADSTINMDAFAMGAVVADINGDAGLKIGNYWNKTGYVYLNSQTNKGTNYVFETDLKLNSGSTSRSDNTVFQIYASKQKNAVSAFWPMQITIKHIDGVYYLNLYSQSFEIEASTWYNLRIEIDDITKTGDVRYYVNGTLVYTANSTSTATELGSMAIWMPQTTQGVLELDNVFFGALDPVDDEPEVPGDDNTGDDNTGDDSTGGETGGSQLPESERGSGVYADSALNFTDTTATELGADGKLVSSDNATLDGANMYAKVVDKDSDSALALANSAWNSSGYINLAASSTGSYMVFETDFNLSSAITSCGSSRSDTSIFQICLGKSSTASNWSWGGGLMLVIDKTDASNPIYKIKTGNGTYCEIEIEEWYTLRVELSDITTTGSEIRYYVNGQLIATEAFGNATNADNADFIRIWMPGQSSGTLYLDNLYYGAASEE